MERYGDSIETEKNSLFQNLLFLFEIILYSGVCSPDKNPQDIPPALFEGVPSCW